MWRTRATAPACGSAWSCPVRLTARAMSGLEHTARCESCKITCSRTLMVISSPSRGLLCVLTLVSVIAL